MAGITALVGMYVSVYRCGETVAHVAFTPKLWGFVAVVCIVLAEEHYNSNR